jgi:RNA polymerase sigma-70 factor, ECF subfamily
MDLLTEQDTVEAALLDSCRTGDVAAFATLVDTYKDRIYNMAFRYLGRHEDAEDVAQETFVRAYRGIQDFEGRSRVYTWLYSIAGNLARNHVRDRARKGRNQAVSLDQISDRGAALAQDFGAAAETPGTLAQAHELQDLLQQCVEELPEHYRLVFILRTYEGLTYDEIAEAVRCPRGTVKSRLNQARVQLRDRLKAMSVL